MLERLLAWAAKHERPNLSMREAARLAIRQVLGEAMRRVAMEGQERRQPVEPIKCAGCGRQMRNNGGQGRAIARRLDELAIERGADSGPHGNAGVFPPGSATWGERAVLECGLGAGDGVVARCGECVSAVFVRRGQLTISPMSAWRLSQVVGRQWQKMSEQGSAAAHRLPQKEEAPVACQAERGRMGVALVGFMLHLGEEGGKECQLCAAALTNAAAFTSVATYFQRHH
ncbi:MAG: hypothetical protein U0350_40845 [Caldilineaceae bacterium]